MNILNKIKKDQLAARKNKDQEKTSLLTTILGEIQRAPEKPTSDQEVELIVRNWIKKVLKDIQKNPFDGKDKIIQNLVFIEQEYLPKINKLNHQQIEELVKQSGANNKFELMQFINKYEKENRVIVDKAYAAKIF